MTGGLYRVRENLPLTRDMTRMRLEGDTSGLTHPGQFVDRRCRRSISGGPSACATGGRGS